MNHSDIRIAKKMVQLELSAKKRKIGFDLTFSRYKRLLNTNRCYFTGKLLDSTERSIDRLDSSIGYTDKNTVICDRRLNMRKGSLSPKEITQLYKGLKRKGLI